MKKIAVILCGSGFKDGSEIHESVAVLWALSQHPVKVQCFAPDAEQADVVNCLNGKIATNEKRNMLVESARIARGEVMALSRMDPTSFDAVIFPGGFGAAKNLCNFAVAGSQGSVLADVQRVLEPIHSAKKPIGAICIAPAIIGLAFKHRGFEMTVGEESEASQEIEKMGHSHIACKANECHVDSIHRIVSTPAYMCEAPLHEIFTGIQKLVTEVVRLA